MTDAVKAGVVGAGDGWSAASQEQVSHQSFVTPDAPPQTRVPEADRIEITAASVRRVPRNDGREMTIISIATKSLDRTMEDKLEFILPDALAENFQTPSSELSTTIAPGRFRSEVQDASKIRNAAPLFLYDKHGNPVLTKTTSRPVINQATGELQKVVAVAALQGRTYNGEPTERVFDAIYTAGGPNVDQFVAALDQVLRGTEAVQVRSEGKDGFMRVRKLIHPDEQTNPKAYPKNTRFSWDATT